MDTEEVPKQAILIGFVYQRSKSPLLGVLVDLYRVYRFLEENGFQRIDLVTDLIDDPTSTNYHQTILEGCVDANLLSFISTTKKQERYHYVTEPEELKNVIDSLLRNKASPLDEREKKKFLPNRSCHLFIYMTGHGEEKGFLCPKSIITWTDLQGTIFTPLTRYHRVIMFLDMCHAWDFQLPFVLSKKDNRLLFIGTRFFPSCQLILLSTKGNKAAMTMSGSLATGSLITLLEKGCYRDCYDLCQRINSDLASTETLRSLNLQLVVYTTFPNLYRLWSWLWKRRKPIYCFDKDIFIEIRSKRSKRSKGRSKNLISV